MPARASAAQADTAERVLEITRLFDAPRHLVFDVWTRQEHRSKWWGPRGFTLIHSESDPRPGGRYRFGMHSPEHGEHWAHGVYREVSPPERLVFTMAWEDEAGRPKHETVLTLTFAEEGAKTRLTLHQELFESVTSRDSHEGGWSSLLDVLADYLATL